MAYLDQPSRAREEVRKVLAKHRVREWLPGYAAGELESDLTSLIQALFSEYEDDLEDMRGAGC